MTLWGQDTVKDVAESVGIVHLNKEVSQALSRDIEYRISQVLQEALKFMKHAKRTILWTQDISQALRVLDVEPLYGYETTRPLKYGEASLGPGQPLFYVEDEEMDFEKLINAPLPKVPREVSFTAHWLAVEGVQPSIPQNPTSNESRNLELLPKGPNANPALAAMTGADTTTTKPQVKHILSKELQLYFEKVCASVLDETQPEYRTAGLASLKDDPGLHQLLPYFVQFVAEKVTHNLKDLFVLTQMMLVIDALTRNSTLNLTPYVASLVPPVLTCLIGRTLGSGIGSLDHYELRDLAASLLGHLCHKYSKYSHNLKPRLARSLLKTFLDPTKPLGSHYGAILGLKAIGGAEVVRQLIIPNLKAFGELLDDDLQDSSVKKAEAEKVVSAILNALGTLVDDEIPMMNGHSEESANELRTKLVDTIGPVIGSRIADASHTTLAKAILEGGLLGLQ
ncbi:transcription initiation factor TFIID subunit 6 [Capronia epimyces CBS 606.96]|uniref:TBP-associated factor 6 n=1 Tax=Capronia epimyces CBS 606.96 TaxID=1182542 RepID=W9YR11_9EURO|nr:transcription initiation factor TFIID subunit 6 [Capronia epimyces CBS 606.96]EXJ92110.1 transcription initiation factor TFIID subunit 6 [Capronia epimyces CBS 606.96]